MVLQGKLAGAVFAIVGLFACALVAWGSALAEDRPVNLWPTRDVELVYSFTIDPGAWRAHTEGKGPLPSVTVHVKKGGNLIRVDVGLADPGGYIVMDLSKRRATLVRPSQRMYMGITVDSALDWLQMQGIQRPDIPRSDQMQFSRKGELVMLSYHCTVWEVQANQFAARACLTDDGLLLRGEGRFDLGNNNRGWGIIDAVSVTFAPQPDKLFEPPTDYTGAEINMHMPLPGAEGR